MKSILSLLFFVLAVGHTAPVSTIAQVNVLFPPSNSKDVQTYLLNNPLVSGVDLVVNWADVDKGSGKYDFSIPDALIAPWKNAGKTVNLVVWANSNSAAGTIGNASVPAYIWTALGPSNYVTCTTQAGDQRMPNYLAPIWASSYQKFLAAVAAHYAGKVGYIRGGLGHGGETIPTAGWNDPQTACGKAYAKWGLTITTWEAYLAEMLRFEAAQKGVQFMVGITPLGKGGIEVPDYIASVAAPLGIGFGSQGLESLDLKGCATSTADWCNLFKKYPKVPHELQTIGQSCPSGKGCTGNQALTGPLPPLLVFGKTNGANVFEIYYSDWLLAFDPHATGYAQYGVAYAAAIKAAAGK